jgi:hypothetical protein
MPAKSKQQQKFMGMVHALNKGDIKPSDVSQSVRDVAKNIKKSDAEDFASTKHSGLPKRVKQEILDALKEYANKMSGNKHGGSGSYGYAPQKGLRDDDGYEDNEEVKDESKGVPQNYMQGRTSDYHTALRGKNRDYSGGTNFKKTNHGQPDLENDDEDQETNQLSVQQTKLKEEMGKLSSSERIELYKLYSKAMKAMPGSPNQKKIKILINKLRKKADLKPLPINEAKLDHHRISGNSIELLVRHNREKFAIKFKDKRILDKMGFDWSKPKNIEKLLSLKKFPKGMSVSRSFHEYGQRLDLSYLEDEETRLDGTPKPKDAIDRDIEEYSGGSYEYTKGDQYGQNSVNEVGVFPITSYMKGIIPANFVNTTTREKKERLKSTLKDLKNTLNHFWKQHKIPYRVK